MKNSYAHYILSLSGLFCFYGHMVQASEDNTSLLYGSKHRNYQVPPPTVAKMTAQRAQKKTKKTACQLRTIERNTKNNETQGY